MKPCKNLQRGKCMEMRAVPRFGVWPTASACRRCPFYKGPWRGLGDAVAWLIGLTPWGKRRKGCGPCSARQAALNKAVPLTISENCGKCGKSAKAP